MVQLVQNVIMFRLTRTDVMQTQTIAGTHDGLAMKTWAGPVGEDTLADSAPDDRRSGEAPAMLL